MAIDRSDPLVMAALASAAVPELDIVTTRLDNLGSDFAFAELEDASGRFWTVRIPLHDSAETGQVAELKLLKSLAGASSGGALPFEVPRPRGTAQSRQGGTAIVYSRLPGVPLVLELMPAGPGLAQSLGQAIAAFHQLPPAIVTEAGLPAYTPSVYRAQLATELNDAVRSGHVSHRLEDRWRRKLECDPWWVFTPVPIHGDMAAEHLLHNSDRISAMTNFNSVQVSDPAEDLGRLFPALTHEAGGWIVGAYRARRLDLDDPHLEDRAAFLGEMAIVRWLRQGLALGDQTIIDDARGVLADLDTAVQAEEEESGREADAEVASRERLQGGRTATQPEAWHGRHAGWTPRATARGSRTGDPGLAGETSAALGAPDDTSPPWASPEVSPLADPWTGQASGDVSDGPVRRSVAAGGVGVWGRPASIPSWDAPDLGDGLPDLEDANPPGGGPPSADSPGTGSEPVPPRPPSPPSGGSPSVDAPGTGFEPVPPRPFGGAATDGPPSGDPAAGGSAEGPPEEAPVPEVDATQAYLPDFLRDESEAPSDIPGAPPKDAPDLDEDSYTQPA